MLLTATPTACRESANIINLIYNQLTTNYNHGASLNFNRPAVHHKLKLFLEQATPDLRLTSE